MIIIKNNIIPFSGFLAINIFGILFVREEYWKSRNDNAKKTTLNHESIHTAQMKELLYVFFYIIYFFEWIVRLFINGKNAYDNISFEKEAYFNQNDLDYLKTRKHYAQWRTGK